MRLRFCLAEAIDAFVSSLTDAMHMHLTQAVQALDELRKAVYDILKKAQLWLDLNIQVPGVRLPRFSPRRSTWMIFAFDG